MQHTDSNSVRTIVMSTLLMALLCFGFKVFYNILMCLMFLHRVLLNGPGSQQVYYSIKLLNILPAACVYL